MRKVSVKQVLTRPSTPADLDELMELLMIPGLAEAAGLTLGGDPVGIRWALQSWGAAGQVWTVRVQDRVVGLVAAFPLGPNQRELGYLLNPTWWGRGIMTIAVGRVVTALGDQELVATTALTNQASQKILARHGFTRRGREGAVIHWTRRTRGN